MRQEKTDSVVKTNLSVPQWADTSYGLLSFPGLAASLHKQTYVPSLYTHTYKHTYNQGRSGAGVRISPNYSNYLSSKHSLPQLPPGIQKEAECVEVRRREEGEV